MNLAQRLEARQTQSIVMTPQLRQAIELLQMSSQEANAYVAEEIEKNPLLERAEDAGGVSPETREFSVHVMPRQDTAAVDSAAVAAAFSSLAGTVSAANVPLEESGVEEFGGGEEYFAGGYYEEHAHGAGRGGNFDDGFSTALNMAAGSSLREHLLGQIHVDFPDAVERMTAIALVELLDEAGYLPSDLELVRAQMGVSPELLEKVVWKLQRLDPPGIFARSLQECLAIQLREKNRLDPAMQNLLLHLDLVAKRDDKALMRICGVDAEDLAGMIREIRALNPKPATAYEMDAALPVTPDVLLYPLPGGGWRVELNGASLPRVLANEEYYLKVRESVRSGGEREYIGERWQRANWLVKALHQRATTILKVAAEIVRRQDEFFVYGVQRLRPLVLRDVAEAVEMHESTVSRVTRNKYIATPRGTFELKYFFSGSIAATGGENSVSAIAVRERIREMVNAEPSDAVLSDDQIVSLLRLEGVDIARRTVAKYREVMRIPSSAQRRREKRTALPANV